MTREEVLNLLEAVYSKADYDFLFAKAANDFDFFKMIWDISKEQPFNKSWRLLWILDHATRKKNDFIFPILDDLYKLALATNNESYIRQSMLLILRCPLNEDYMSELLERSIVWMNDPKGKISSQALGLEFFYQVCKIYPEMSPELLANIEDLMERKPSAGMNIRLKKIRSELEKRKDY